MKRYIRGCLCMAALAASALMSGEVSAGTSTSTVTTQDLSKPTCGEWENGRRNGTAANVEVSALALVSLAYMQYAQQNVPAKGPREPNEIFRALDTTCAGQPATTLLQAVQQMISIDCEHATGGYKTLCDMPKR